MKDSVSGKTRICRKCHQELPIEAFYMVKQQPDYYCKECRSNHNRLRRKTRNQPPPTNTGACQQLPITQVPDRQLRIELIRHAKQMVAESVGRRRRKIIDQQYEEFE